MSVDQEHIPVMLDEVLDAAAVGEGDHIIDGTFGAGGYSRAFLERGARVTAFDRDPQAVRGAAIFHDDYGDRFAIRHAPFSAIGDSVAAQSIDALVLDIGVSSMQFDQADRGFSFRHDGPLDMRMSSDGLSAADIVNTALPADLTRIIGILGEEKQASRISRAICDARAAQPIETTGALARIIEKAVARKHSDTIHPATRSFQALRILVNDELRELARALFAAETVLRDGGRLVVVSFHSLEDRIVKTFLSSRSGKSGGSRHLPQPDATPAVFIQSGKSVISASATEIQRNPRARSAKLRAATRTDAPAMTADFELFRFARLPWPGSAPSASGRRLQP